MQDAMNTAGQKVHLELYRHKNSVVNDAYDRMVSGIHLHKKNKGISTFTVTGCEPGAGATTIAISLAISMALSGQRTVLVDTDMKKGSNNKRLNQEIEYGLSHFLTGEVSAETIFCDTNFGNLKYITCGQVHDNALELLCSNHFDKLLAYIRESFDIAIFDSPSLNATVDASILAARTDAVILVAEQNKTTTTQIRSSKRELENVGANLLGIVLNQVGKKEYKSFLKHYDYYKRKVPEPRNK